MANEEHNSFLLCVVLVMLLDYVYIVMQIYSDLLALSGSEKCGVMRNCISQFRSVGSVSEIGVIF
jgi:hypothetical protein